MDWSIAEVARMSNVTSRTLRHYDHIGLLRPAYVADNGHRHYEQVQLLRLQRVLLLRELGLGLPAISQVLAGEQDQVAALRRHAQQLRAERDRLDRLASTVSRTIHQLTEGAAMTATEMFDGFTERRDRLEADLVQQHGEGVREHFREAEQLTRDWTRNDYLDAQRRNEQLEERIVAVLRSGAGPDSPAAMAVMAEHYAMVSQHWTPDRDSYTGLGQLYVDNPDFREHYDARDPALAEYLRDATAAYAREHLD